MPAPVHDGEDRDVARQDHVVHHAREPAQPQLPDVVDRDRELLRVPLDRRQRDPRRAQELVANPVLRSSCHRNASAKSARAWRRMNKRAGEELTRRAPRSHRGPSAEQGRLREPQRPRSAAQASDDLRPEAAFRGAFVGSNDPSGGR